MHIKSPPGSIYPGEQCATICPKVEMFALTVADSIGYFAVLLKSNKTDVDIELDSIKKSLQEKPELNIHVFGTAEFNEDKRKTMNANTTTRIIIAQP